MRKFPHAATYRKLVVSIVDSESTNSLTGPQELKCLVEPIAQRVRETLAARINDPSFVISWASPNLDNGDVVVWDGEEYTLNEVTKDVLRGRSPYYTAVLAGTYV